MFRTLLIANRGEIAARIAATCQALGISVAVPYTEADAGALHTRCADAAYPLESASGTRGYLDIEAIIQAALRAGAEALHPGYGFLAENPGLVEACHEAGITFVGPGPEAMRLLGSKSAAKELAERVGVPTVPGYHGQDQDDQKLLTEAQRIGVPLLIKATAGGGGRGMRTVHDLAEFSQALAAARREARAAFGDDRVLLERLVSHPRHVEIQIFGDQHGQVIHLGERECSIQRRHQKIIEEAPSPAVSPALRVEMGAAAVALARAAGYVNAGTVEFMLTDNGRFYFLEMNTRLQVEHPVTELVTGLDLVELQLRIAAGEPLPFTQDQVMLRGHALQCRLYAEDPATGFLPSTGELTYFALPQGPGIRLDTGVETGDTVSLHYDPLLAKLLSYGETRQQALARGYWLLQHSSVLGVTTNLSTLQRVLAHPAFQAGALSTVFLDEHHLLTPDAPTTPHEVLLLAALWFSSDAEAVTGPDPWRSGSSWSAATQRTLELTVADKIAVVHVERGVLPLWSLRIGERHDEITRLQRLGDELIVHLEGRVLRGVVQRERGSAGTLLISYGGQVWHVSLRQPPSVDAVLAGEHSSHDHGQSGTLVTPMPGTVLALYVQEGEQVQLHQRVAVLEAMKMEHVLEAPHAGTVRRIVHRVGDVVAAGATIVEIEEG